MVNEIGFERKLDSSDCGNVAVQASQAEQSWRPDFERQGFIRFSVPLPGGSGWEDDLISLQDTYASLPPDPYAEYAGRFRRYGRAVLLPWSHTLEWIPNVIDDDGRAWAEYFQGSYNPEFSNEIRRFPPLTSELLANRVLYHIIWYDYAQTFWKHGCNVLPMHAGVHLVKLRTESAAQPAISSPNHLHRDGEPFTFAHLIVRSNADGGVNVIAHPQCDGLMPEDISNRLIIKKFELGDTLDSYGVCDTKVSHYVSPVTPQDGDAPAERGVLLIDFTQMIQRI